MIHDRLHPLFHARRVPIVRDLLLRLDRPIWCRLDGIESPVRVRLVSHASYVAMRRSPERAITELMRALVSLAPPRRFLDVGANFGYYGLLVKSLAPDSAVIMVEPEPENVVLIEATLNRTPQDGIELHAVALSAQEGEATLSRDRISGATGSLEKTAGFAARMWNAPTAELRVMTTTLDALVGDLPVDIVKIDIEGHEESALRGAVSVLERLGPILFVECGHRDGRLERLLLPYGYRLLDADRIGPVGEQTKNLLAWTSRSEAEVMRACELARGVIGRNSL